MCIIGVRSHDYKAESLIVATIISKHSRINWKIEEW